MITHLSDLPVCLVPTNSYKYFSWNESAWLFTIVLSEKFTDKANWSNVTMGRQGNTRNKQERVIMWMYLDDGAKSAMMYIVCAAVLINRFCLFASSDGSSMTTFVLVTHFNDFGSLQTRLRTQPSQYTATVILYNMKTWLSIGSLSHLEQQRGAWHGIHPFRPHLPNVTGTHQ